MSLDIDFSHFCAIYNSDKTMLLDCRYFKSFKAASDFYEEWRDKRYPIYEDGVCKSGIVGEPEVLEVS